MPRPPLPRVLERAASKAASCTAFGPAGFAPQLRGSIFLTNSANQGECLRRGLFGLPSGQAKLLRQIDAARDRTLLFLFNFQKRRLLGAFIATGPAGFPLEASARQRAGQGRLGGTTGHSPGLLWPDAPGLTLRAPSRASRLGRAAAPLGPPNKRDAARP